MATTQSRPQVTSALQGALHVRAHTHPTPGSDPLHPQRALDTRPLQSGSCGRLTVSSTNCSGM